MESAGVKSPACFQATRSRRPDSLAKLVADGPSVLVMQNVLAKFMGDAVELSAGIGRHVQGHSGALTFAPSAHSQSKFELSNTRVR